MFAAFQVPLVATGPTLPWCLACLGCLALAIPTGDEEVKPRRIDAPLLANPALLAGIVDAAMDAIVSINAHQTIVLFNAAAERMFGLSAQDAIGRPIDTLIPARFHGVHGQHIEDFGATGVTSRTMGSLGTLSGLRSTGEEFPIEASISQVDVSGQKLFTVILRDVSERRRAQEALQAERDFISALLDTVGSLVVVLDREGSIVRFNRACEELTGYTFEEAKGRDVIELLMLPEEVAAAREALKGICAGNFPSAHRYFVATKGGSRRLIDWYDTCLVDARGEVEYVIGTGTDITERDRAEEPMARMAAIVEYSDDAIIGKDLNGIVTSWNAGAEHLFGYTASEMVGHSITLLIPAEREAEEEEILGRIKRGENISHFETVRLTKDGQKVDVSVTVSPIKDGSGTILGASKIARDITASKRVATDLRAKNEEVRAMSQQLWQTAKLATMGELAASIAHELNNPLFTVTLRIESILAQLAPDDPKRRSAEIVEQEVKRMADLVAQLLQFSRRGQSQSSTLDLREEVEKTLDLITFHLRNRKVTVVREFDAELPSVQADRQQIRQTFLNLFNNATDAMPEGGTLTVLIHAEGGNVVVEVRDTGIGIPEENLPRLTESFFTTKPEGKGTGLGLAICRRVVHEHGGQFAIFNGLEGGAVARVTLPATNGGSHRHD